MCYASEREKKNINPYKPYEHTLWNGCENECWRILICTGEMAGHAEIVARCGWCGHQPQAFGIFFWCCRVWVCGTYDTTMRQTHTHTESDLKCVIFHISMDIIKWKKNGIWPQACLTSTLSLSHSLYHFPYLAYSVHMWIFVYRMLVWWPETISFCFASFNVSSNSGCFFSYVFFSPSNSDIHSLFFFSCVYTVILASQRTCTRPKRICWSNGVECVAVQYFDVISIWIWNIDSYEHWAITRTTFFISRWSITVLLTEYLLTIFSSFF